MLFFIKVICMRTLLSVQKITKKIWGHKILSDVSFEMKKGEILGLLGPNGAGKTTTIRCLCGLTNIQAGKIIINGYDLHHDFVKAIQNIGVTVENPSFYNYMSGWQNLVQIARIHHIGNQKIASIVTKVQLTKDIYHKVSTYSLGMRQRLNIAYLLLLNPKILLLDEPMNGLDPKGMYLLRNILKDLAQEGTSILVSSHVLHDIEQLANHIVILQKGNVIYNNSLQNLNDEAHQVIHLKVNDIKKTTKILNKLSLRFYMQNNQFYIETIHNINEVQQMIIKNLIANKINIQAIYLQTSSLEEKFLNMTNEVHYDFVNKK